MAMSNHHNSFIFLLLLLIVSFGIVNCYYEPPTLLTTDPASSLCTVNGNFGTTYPTCQLADVNKDELLDWVCSYYQTTSFQQESIYMNNGCGWLPAGSNLTYCVDGANIYSVLARLDSLYNRNVIDLQQKLDLMCEASELVPFNALYSDDSLFLQLAFHKLKRLGKP